MFEWDFISNSCLCSLIPGLLGGNFSCIDYLSGAEELPKISVWCVIQSTSFNTVKNPYNEQSTPEKIGPVLEAGDGCWNKLSQEEECRKLLTRGRNIHVHSRSEESMGEQCQNTKPLSHAVSEAWTMSPAPHWLFIHFFAYLCMCLVFIFLKRC